MSMTLEEFKAKWAEDDRQWEEKKKRWAEAEERQKRREAGQHPLVEQAQGAVNALEAIKAKIADWETNQVYSEQVKQREIANLKADRDHYISGVVSEQWLTEARREFNELVKTKRELTERGRLADPLNNPVSMANASARLKNIAQAAQNLGQFQQAYENAAAAGDPYLLRAFQTESAQYVSRYQEPAGGFLNQLERDYEANFLSKEDREALDWKLGRLRDGLRQAASVARQFYREGIKGNISLMESQPASSPDVQLSNLLNEVNTALGGDGFHGGFYQAPNGQPNIIFIQEEFDHGES